MFATLSYENRIMEKMRALGCTADFLSVMARVPASRLSHAFRGVRPLTNEDGEMFMDILNALENLVESVSPVPVSFKNPQLIRDLIKDRSERTSVAAAS
jgi:hypothetical protein